MNRKQKIISRSLKKKNNCSIFHLVIFFLLILLDQATKYWVRTHLFPGRSIDPLNFLSITYLQNTGVSFGMFKGLNLLFTAVLVCAFVYFLILFLKRINYRVQIIFILAGITGNLIDRLTLGYVVDFINFHFWPVFNIADSCVFIGVFWLIIASSVNKEEIF
ncbi:MAG: signal peptidase II [archaeon]